MGRDFLKLMMWYIFFAFVLGALWGIAATKLVNLGV